MSDNPIGVFDSGLGGLSAVKELRHLLPNENIVYFGDTGRVPYGGKSGDTIRKYALQDINFLESKNVKMIIAACGTVSSFAYDFDKLLSVPFTGVLKPTAYAAVSATKNGKIGVIGTSATINSKSYEKEINNMDKSIKVYQRSCPLFVPLVENGFIEKDNLITKLTVEHYLSELKSIGVDTLILGCTHYPILKDFIQEFVGEKVTLIDSGKETALYASTLLKEFNIQNNGEGKCEFYVSDTTEDFSRIAGMFLNKKIDGSVHRIEIENY